MFFLWFAVAAKWTLVTAISPPDYCASYSSIQNFGGFLSGACWPVLNGLIVDRTGSFVLALAIGGILTALAAAIFYFMVGGPITNADLGAPRAAETVQAGEPAAAPIRSAC